MLSTKFMNSMASIQIFYFGAKSDSCPAVSKHTQYNLNSSFKGLYRHMLNVI